MTNPLFGLAILVPAPGRPCVVCAGYPAGWEVEVQKRGEVTICDRHVESLQDLINGELAKAGPVAKPKPQRILEALEGVLGGGDG